MRVGIIGGGVMGEAILGAALEQGLFGATETVVAEIVQARREALAATHGVSTTASASEAMDGAELVLPVAKDVRFQVGQRTNFADGVKLLDWSGGGHFHCSDLSSRAMSSVMPSRAAFPLNRTSQTFSMMGSSTPIRSPSAAPAFEVLAPSATLR